MSALFKKYAWVVNLVALALLALVAAGPLTDAIRAALFRLPSAQRLVSAHAGDADAVVQSNSLGRVRGEDPSAALVERRVFNLAGPKPPRAPPPPVPTKPAEEQPARGVLVESELPIDLLGTLVSSGGEHDYATLRVDGKPRVTQPGRTLMGGKAKVVKIAPGHIVLHERGEGFTYVVLEEEAPPAPVAARSGGVASAPRATGTGLRGAVQRQGPAAYRVDRGALTRELGDAARLRREARSVVGHHGGRPVGTKLIGVRPGSALRALGIRSGDIVTAVGGQPLPQRDGALVLLQRLAGAARTKVEIIRRGRPKTLSYEVR